MTTTNDTPRTDACPHCGKWHDPYRSCVTKYSEIISDLLANYTAMTERARKAKAEVERLTKLTEDFLNVIRVYCPTYYQDAMDRFNKTTK